MEQCYGPYEIASSAGGATEHSIQSSEWELAKERLWLTPEAVSRSCMEAVPRCIVFLARAVLSLKCTLTFIVKDKLIAKMKHVCKEFWLY